MAWRPGPGLAELLTARLTKAQIQPRDLLTEVRPDLWLLRGGRELANAERMMSQSMEPMQEMTRALRVFENAFTYAIVDTSPGWGTMLINVLMFAHEVVSPVSLESLSLDGLVDFTERLEDVREVNTRVSLRFVVPTFYDRRTAQSDLFITQVRNAYPDEVCDAVRVSVKLSEAPAFGKTIYEYAPRSTGAEDYGRLVARVANG